MKIMTLIKPRNASAAPAAPRRPLGAASVVLAMSMATVVVLPANAALSSNLVRDVHSAAGDHGFKVLIDGDTVTLSGYVEDSYAKNRAEHAAKKAGADKVINRLLLD